MCNTAQYHLSHPCMATLFNVSVTLYYRKTRPAAIVYWGINHSQELRNWWEPSGCNQKEKHQVKQQRAPPLEVPRGAGALLSAVAHSMVHILFARSKSWIPECNGELEVWLWSSSLQVSCPWLTCVINWHRLGKYLEAYCCIVMGMYPVYSRYGTVHRTCCRSWLKWVS